MLLSKAVLKPENAEPTRLQGQFLQGLDEGLRLSSGLFRAELLNANLSVLVCRGLRVAGRVWGWSPSLWQPWARFMSSDQDHVPARLGCSFNPKPHEEMYDGWPMSLMFLT